MDREKRSALSRSWARPPCTGSSCGRLRGGPVGWPLAASGRGCILSAVWPGRHLRLLRRPTNEGETDRQRGKWGGPTNEAKEEEPATDEEQRSAADESNASADFVSYEVSAEVTIATCRHSCSHVHPRIPDATRYRKSSERKYLRSRSGPFTTLHWIRPHESSCDLENDDCHPCGLPRTPPSASSDESAKIRALRPLCVPPQCACVAGFACPFAPVSESSRCRCADCHCAVASAHWRQSAPLSLLSSSLLHSRC